MCKLSFMKNSLTTLFIGFLIVIATPVSAQEVRFDRPLESISADILPVKTIAVESGLAFEYMNSKAFSYRTPDIQARIGMMKLMEMTVGLQVKGIRSSVNGSTSNRVGFVSPVLGLKVTMKEREASKIGIAFSGGASLNFGSKQFKDTKILPNFKVAMDVNWNERANTRINYGIAWQENRKVIDPEGKPVIDPFILVALSTIGTITEKLALFGEFSALVKHDNFRSDYFLGGGLLVRSSNDMQFDLSGRAGLSPQSPRFEFRLGFSGIWPKKNIPAHDDPGAS